MKLRALSFLVPFLFLLFMLFRIDDSLMVDLGRQIRMGEVIVNCHCVPQINLFTFTHPDFPVVNHSWLSSVVFYLLSKSFGLESLLYLKTFLIISTFVIMYFLVVRKDNLAVSTGLLLLGLEIWATRFNVRPELFSYLFIALMLLLFELYRRNKRMLLLWSIPFMIVLWVNMHIYFFIGVLLFFFFLAEQVIAKRRIARGWLLLAGTVLAAPLINPSFVKGALYPLLIFNNYGAKIIENYPPLMILGAGYPFTFEVYAIVLFELLSCIALAGILVYPRRELIADKLQSVLGIILGQVILRSMALFSLLSLPFLVKEYEFIYNRASSRVKKQFRTGTIMVLSVLFVAGLGMQTKEVGFSFRDDYADGVTFLQQHNLKGPLFNNLSTGNYLTYRLYPEKVFVDSRPEAYPASFFQGYYTLMRDMEYFNQEMDAHTIATVFFSPADYPQLSLVFLQKLSQDIRWAPVFWDGNVAIFVRNTEEYKKIISGNNDVRTKLQKDLRIEE